MAEEILFRTLTSITVFRDIDLTLSYCVTTSSEVHNGTPKRTNCPITQLVTNMMDGRTTIELLPDKSQQRFM